VVNTGETKYMVMSCHHAGQNRNLLINNKSCGNVAHFKYLRMAVTEQNFIHKEIKTRLNSGNASYHSAENRSSSVCSLKTYD
jgi:hypothetical protein